MPPDAIEVHNLTKRFDDLVAVDGVTFRVPRGAVYGFLGPNGSGKTTTLGMLTGLIPPDGGSARIGGWDVAREQTEALSTVGAMVEEPAFYPTLTGRANLAVVARLVHAPRERIDETLARVGLGGDAAQQKYKAYSQGMRRRLGLAAALLPEPDVLILDEPTNGLDPAGQLEVRAILHEFAAAGRTVLVSSHMLHEVQEACTHAAILRKGRVVAEGTMADLLSSPGERLVIEVDDTARALELLRGLSLVRRATYEGGQTILVEAARESSSAVNRALVDAGIAVSSLARERTGLEARFFEMTEER